MAISPARGGLPLRARLLLGVLVLGLLAFVVWRVARPRTAEGVSAITASGIIEARTIEIASEISGTIIQRPIDKGSSLVPGQLVAVVASDITAASLDQANAALLAARDQAIRADEAVGLQRGVSAAEVQKAAAVMSTAAARSADVQAGPRSQEIEASKAGVQQAAAARQSAAAQYAELQAGLRPEEIRQAEAAYSAATAAVSTARSQLADLEAGARPQEIQTAQAQVSKAEAAAVKTEREYHGAQGLFASGAIAALQLDAYWSAYVAAQADLKAAREQLALVQSGTRTEQIAAARGRLEQALAQQQGAREALALARQGPRREQVARAAAGVRQAEGAYEAAGAGLRLAQAGSRPDQIRMAQSQVREARAGLQQARANSAQINLRQSEASAARAQVAQAQAAVASAEANLNKFTIRAPAAGMIDDTHVRVGEVVRPGSSIATMVDFSDTWVTVYVPEPALPLVKLGAIAEIRVDGLPNRSLRGYVRRIASQAEFTPKFVQTQEERARTVFAVEIAVPNTERLLKPGMPADARIEVAPNLAGSARR